MHDPEETARWIAANRVRRGLVVVFVGGAVGGAGALAPTTPTAIAAQDPRAASQVAKTIGGGATR